MSETGPFWERSEQVEFFAGREPDCRLMEIIKEFKKPAATRILDLGCAGGRNAVFLAEKGFDVWAVDASRAMVKKTRERLSAVLDPQAAGRRVLLERMDNLKAFPSGTFHLVVALGIYHNAMNREQWDGSIRETARVLIPDGRVLVANFTPRTDLTGKGHRPVPGEPHLYEDFEVGRLTLLEADELDEEMGRFGFYPVVPSETVVKKTEEGQRVTVNALYQLSGQRES
ncbi:class I SAM-dependent methyltransferase [Acidobacteriota bacterium]